MSRTNQRQLAVEVESQQGLEIELAARGSHRGGNAPATAKCIKVVDHEVGMDEIPRLLCPRDKFLRSQTSISLTDRLEDEKGFRRRA